MLFHIPRVRVIVALGVNICNTPVTVHVPFHSATRWDHQLKRHPSFNFHRVNIVAPTRILRPDPHAQPIPFLGMFQNHFVLDNGPVLYEHQPRMDVPHDLYPRNLVVVLSVIQSEFEPGPAVLTGPLFLGVRTPPLVLGICCDNKPTKGVREFSSRDAPRLEVSVVGVAEPARV